MSVLGRTFNKNAMVFLYNIMHLFFKMYSIDCIGIVLVYTLYTIYSTRMYIFHIPKKGWIFWEGGGGSLTAAKN